MAASPSLGRDGEKLVGVDVGNAHSVVTARAHAANDDVGRVGVITALAGVNPVKNTWTTACHDRSPV